MKNKVAVKNNLQYSAVRHGQIVHELAAMFGLPVSDALHAFYESAYATAVYDIADGMAPGATREQVIAQFAPPRKDEPSSQDLSL